MDALGIDIGGSSVKAAMLRHGRVVWTGRSGVYSQATAGQLVGAIREAIAGREVAVDRVGVCCPGILDRASGVIALSVNVPGLVGVKLQELVESGIGRRVAGLEILSDANAAGYDLYVTRGLSGRLLSLTLGTGVGASVVDDGKFLQVSGETPGHFGQMDVSLDASPPVGADGGAGSLEAYVGAGALAGRLGENFVERLSVDDPAIGALVRAIRIGHAIYRPMHVGLAGGVGIRLGRLLPEMKAGIERGLTRVARGDWTLFMGESDFHAACGVGRYAGKSVGII